VPYLAYAATLAWGRLVADHPANHPQAPYLRRVIACDPPSALLEYALKGIGVAWLPRSLAGSACQAEQLTVLGDDRLIVAFAARLYWPKRLFSPLAEAVWKLGGSL
jgi:DNA-binding transcriptional LysR family regulator